MNSQHSLASSDRPEPDAGKPASRVIPAGLREPSEERWAREVRFGDQETEQPVRALTLQVADPSSSCAP